MVDWKRLDETVMQIGILCTVCFLAITVMMMQLNETAKPGYTEAATNAILHNQPIDASGLPEHSSWIDMFLMLLILGAVSPFAYMTIRVFVGN